MIKTVKEPHIVKAGKEHLCDYCDKKIAIGEQHEVATYAYNRKMYDWRACDRCKPFVDEMNENENYSWDDGISKEDFYNYMQKEYQDIASEWWPKE